MITRPVYKALHRPLFYFEGIGLPIERKMFALAVIAGVVTFNGLYSFLAGLLVFVLVYAIGYRTRHDAAFLRLLMRSRAHRRVYDAGKHEIVTVEIR